MDDGRDVGFAEGPHPRLLIVHPKRHVADVLSTILRPLRVGFDHAPDDAAVVSRVGQPFALMLVAVDPSDPDALELLAYSRRKQPWLPVIMLLTSPDTRRAKEAMRLGAVAVLGYPCPPVELREAVSDALRATRPDSYAPDPPPEGLDPGPAHPPARDVADRGPTVAADDPPRGSSGFDPAPARTGSLREDVEAYERLLILRTLRDLDWNRGATARALDINRTTLYIKMKKYELL